ncbi:hypothetical protein HOB94_04520 [bacterium]|nr:hypothetical protein [bacterium]MBT4633208.1 hypothetical protein [bacterium]
MSPIFIHITASSNHLIICPAHTWKTIGSPLSKLESNFSQSSCVPV